MYESGEHGDEALLEYANFLRDTERFSSAMKRVGDEWPRSCEHFLTNESMNCIAWLGQAAMCIATGIPRKYRAGFRLLSDSEQSAANAAANAYLKRWRYQHERSNAQGIKPLCECLARARISGRYTRRGASRNSGGMPGAVVQGNLFGSATQ